MSMNIVDYGGILNNTTVQIEHKIGYWIANIEANATIVWHLTQSTILSRQ